MTHVHVPVIVPSAHRVHSNRTHSEENIANKTIVYSDTILPTKDMGTNIKVTSISNVSEYSLETCINKITKSNPNVFFNTI